MECTYSSADLTDLTNTLKAILGIVKEEHHLIQQRTNKVNVQLTIALITNNRLHSCLRLNLVELLSIVTW